MSIAVLGAGAFGTALAISLGHKGPVCLWARNMGGMDKARENTSRLPGCSFPAALFVTDMLADAAKADILLVAVPMQKLRAFLTDHAGLLDGKTIVACCKGIELETGKGPLAVIRDTLPLAVPAILTGPSFGADIARGLPTALTLACADPAVGEGLQKALTNQNLRLYRTTDTIGAELGGALKNVVAIACGAAIGAGLGESARAALMTRGFAEMERFAQALGAQPETLAGLSGFGDLVLTCTSDQSRNTRYGRSLGCGEAFDPSITVEGAATGRAVLDRARTLGVDMPITQAIAALVTGELRVAQAVDMLLSRPLKEE